jgi:hypothetical protein
VLLKFLSYYVVFPRVLRILYNFIHVLFWILLCCFSLLKNLSSHLLITKQWCTINRNSCAHFHSFRKLAVQGKVQAIELQGRGFLFLLFSIGYVFLLFCNDVGCHEQLNLSWLVFQDETLLIYWIQLTKFFFIQFIIQVSDLICICTILNAFLTIGWPDL